LCLGLLQTQQLLLKLDNLLLQLLLLSLHKIILSWDYIQLFPPLHVSLYPPSSETS
jgi:hypothetical protein